MKVLVRQKAFNALKPFYFLRRMTLLITTVVLFISNSNAQKVITVSGQITNDSGQPISRASITVKGKNVGVVSDDNGVFQINAPDNAVLIISSVNYGTQEISVKGKNITDCSFNF